MAMKPGKPKPKAPMPTGRVTSKMPRIAPPKGFTSNMPRIPAPKGITSNMPRVPAPRGVRQPAPMPKATPGGTAKRPGNPSLRGKRTSPSTLVPKVKPKNPKIKNPKKKLTLDDFLLKGKKPPMRIKPGLKRPSDADVIIKGYNDKKYKGK